MHELLRVPRSIKVITTARIVLTLESFVSVPAFIFFSSKSCNIHGELLELFCGEHQEPCCSECASACHARCTGINLFSKAAKGKRCYKVPYNPPLLGLACFGKKMVVSIGSSTNSKFCFNSTEKGVRPLFDHCYITYVHIHSSDFD